MTSVRKGDVPLTRYVKLPVVHALGIPRTFFPPTWFSDPDMSHGTCVTNVLWCIPWSLTSGFLWKSVAGKTLPAFPAHAQTAILNIWQEGRGYQLTGYEIALMQVLNIAVGIKLRKMYTACDCRLTCCRKRCLQMMEIYIFCTDSCTSDRI